MVNKPRSPMPVSERAKQFLPFAAVKGLTEALARKDKVLVPKVEMSEELAAKLDEKMHHIQKGSIVTVTYFCDDEYIQLTGRFTRSDDITHRLQIDESKIEFDDVLDIDLILTEQ